MKDELSDLLKDESPDEVVNENYCQEVFVTLTLELERSKGKLPCAKKWWKQVITKRKSHLSYLQHQ